MDAQQPTPEPTKTVPIVDVMPPVKAAEASAEAVPAEQSKEATSAETSAEAKAEAVPQLSDPVAVAASDAPAAVTQPAPIPAKSKGSGASKKSALIVGAAVVLFVVLAALAYLAYSKAN